MPKSDLPTWDEAIERVLKRIDGPIEVSAFIDKLLKVRPSTAKNPASRLRAKIRDDHTGKNLVFLDRDTLVPLRVAAPGIRFRIPLSRMEVEKGVLMIRPSFDGWLSRFYDHPKDFTLFDEKGQKLPTRVVTVKQRATSIFGETDIESEAFDLADWFRAQNARRNDSILGTFECWRPKAFRLELEPAKEFHRHRQEIAKKDQELADILFDMLESSANETLYIHKTIPTAYMHLSDPRGYPGSHWVDVLNRDPRMKVDSWSITYPERLSLLESVLMDGEKPVAKQKFTSQQGNQVYSFKASLKYRKGLWRVIEIQGKQTLSHLDDILREAFGHDSSDHLSGFWKSVRRGKTKRFREIDLGDINPFGEGSAADHKIAELGFQVGDKMRYVYDFGDWVEHEIIMEAIEPPETGVKYPRVSKQSKPRYKYCEHCKAEGRKTVATYICIQCSNEEQRDVLICEDCADKHHEDHYIDEMVY